MYWRKTMKDKGKYKARRERGGGEPHLLQPESTKSKGSVLGLNYNNIRGPDSEEDQARAITSQVKTVHQNIMGGMVQIILEVLRNVWSFCISTMTNGQTPHNRG
jgi:hypothetical protein